jgi:hypothetical protein
MDQVNDGKGWIKGQKIMSIVGEILLLAVLALLFTALVIGK